jgi:glycine betaine transporter
MDTKKDRSVFIISLIVVFLITLWGLVIPDNFGKFANGLFKFFVTNFGWFYLLSMFAFVIFSVVIAFSKYGKIKLGPDDSKPEYSYLSWFAMLFSAGMGVGLVFWGVAEPLNHYMSPNPLEGVEPGSFEAANFAIKTSFFHWGLHPWASYTVLALALAYFQFRKNTPGLISSVFTPLIGEKGVRGPIGKIIDILAIFATVAGVATSLGLGTMQINGGLNYLFGIPISHATHIVIIVVVTAMFMASAISGLDRGIKLLSNINIDIAIVIMVLTLLIGPTIKSINVFTNSIGVYLREFLRDSFRIEAFGDNSWIGGWTIFYWAWWIAWAPFVGTFIARISKGRTIREFVGGVLLIPVLGSFLWFAIFGATSINLGPEVASEAIKVTETAFFVVMKHYPLGSLVSFVAVILLCTFFVTSADSATFVLGMFSSNGNLNPDTKRKVLWGVIQSGLAFALMLAGGLQGLQTASIAAAFPFAIVMLFAMWSLMKALNQEGTSL